MGGTLKGLLGAVNEKNATSDFKLMPEFFHLFLPLSSGPSSN
jgi:hypothetical protein